jgi:hypothetical protein
VEVTVNIKKVENEIKRIFKTNKTEYYKKDWQNDKYVYFASVKVITPEIQSDWSEKFHNGSFYSIAKGVRENYLNISVDVTESDMKEISNEN